MTWLKPAGSAWFARFSRRSQRRSACVAHQRIENYFVPFRLGALFSSKFYVFVLRQNKKGNENVHSGLRGSTGAQTQLQQAFSQALLPLRVNEEMGLHSGDTVVFGPVIAHQNPFKCFFEQSRWLLFQRGAFTFWPLGLLMWRASFWTHHCL